MTSPTSNQIVESHGLFWRHLTVFKMFIWGGISSVIWSEILFYGHISDDIPHQMNILNTVIPIPMHFLTFIRQRHSIFSKLKLRQQRKTTTSTNHKRPHLWRRCSDGISQNILTQILDVIQSDVTLHSQVHQNTISSFLFFPCFKIIFAYNNAPSFSRFSLQSRQ